MPRKKIKLDHPDDPERVKAYIEEKARRSESAAHRKFLKEIPNPTSLPLLSQGNNQQDSVIRRLWRQQFTFEAKLQKLHATTVKPEVGRFFIVLT
jgi:hypothetical protein